MTFHTSQMNVEMTNYLSLPEDFVFLCNKLFLCIKILICYQEPTANIPLDKIFSILETNYFH